MYGLLQWNVREKKQKTKKYHTVETVQNSNRNIAETETKSIPLTHIYMTAHFPVL
jgi:hypothetical protein